MLCCSGSQDCGVSLQLRTTLLLLHRSQLRRISPSRCVQGGQHACSAALARQLTSSVVAAGARLKGRPSRGATGQEGCSQDRWKVRLHSSRAVPLGPCFPEVLAASPCREWHELPAPQMTKEMENDLRLLGLRGVLATDRFYKRPDSKKLPTHFQMGTVIEGPGEFYSGMHPYTLSSLAVYHAVG